MKKKILFLAFLVVAVYAAAFIFYVKKIEKKAVVKKATSQPTPTIIKKVKTSSSIFIPYWDLPKAPTDIFSYDGVIYFGLTVDRSGINTYDQGYQNLSQFNAVTEGRSHRFITVRMTDSDQSVAVLGDEKWQRSIIEDAITIAHKNGMSGIVLDLELSGLFDSNTTAQINSFVQYFYTQTKTNNIGLYMTIYGDTFYRKRPFNIAQLNSYVDGFYVMAYDLHKPLGEPGPNFPLTGKEKFGYDMETMISDYLQYVPAEKLNIVFGMYGYDWIVDENKKPIKAAKSVDLKTIQSTLVDNCPWKNCTNIEDKRAKEWEVDYIDQYLNYHIVWYENEASVQAKKEFLKTQGIGETTYWVYGYF